MKKNAMALAVAAAAGMALSGCPELMPRFDASGAYAGEFSVGLEGRNLIDGCSIELALEHDADGLPLANAKVAGTVKLRFGCIVPDDLADRAGGDADLVLGALSGLGGQALPDGLAGLIAGADIAVEGVVLPDGTIELNTPGILEECTEGGCVKLAMIGQGTDTDGDGAMDNYIGTLAGSRETELGTLPIVGEFAVFRPLD